MEKNYVMKGYQLHLIPTTKFKNITISLKLQNKLDLKTVTKRTLLSFMLVTGTQKYPSTQEFSKFLENLYGMKYGTSVTSKGKSHIINMNSICINQEYLPYQEDLLTQQIQMLNDVLNHPNATNHLFNEQMFEIKKRELKERLIVQKDDKFSYSLEKLFEYMGKDQPLGISTSGYLEELDAITNEELFAYFKQCLMEDHKHLYVVGDIDDSIVSLFEQYLTLPEQNHTYDTSYHYQVYRNDIQEIIEEQDITQSKLNIGYQIDSEFMSHNHYATTVFNALFGGFSQSKLFKVVREQHSLCYYISSSYDAFNGIVIVNAGIERKDYQKTRELIDEQLKLIQQGKFSDEELDIIKGMLKNALTRSKDESLSMISLLYNRDITGKEETDDEYLSKLMAVTKEEIMAIAGTMKLDTIFLLTGRSE